MDMLLKKDIALFDGKHVVRVTHLLKGYQGLQSRCGKRVCITSEDIRRHCLFDTEEQARAALGEQLWTTSN